jgi:transcription elongation factor Elf1
MSVWIDRKYLGFVSSRLDKFKQKNQDLYNFRCIFCGDSQKNRTKARGYIYRKSNDYFYICHNCGKSTTFSKFLEEVDTSVHRQYVMERYTNGETKNHNYKKPDFEDLKGNAFSIFAETKNKHISEIKLESIAKLPIDHYAVEYIKMRLIPEKHWGEIFFAPKFKDFLDSEFPNHGKEEDEVPNDDRIILLYANEKGEITNVAGRALSNTKIRYATIKILDEKKIFGLHKLQKQNKVYVFEGQFDSLFIDNSIATGDSNLVSVPAIYPELNCVLVYDCEPRNREIVKLIEKSIDMGYNICLFPDNSKGKDVNEMIINGLSPEGIKEIIDQNTVSGLTAKLKFIDWKKC